MLLVDWIDSIAASQGASMAKGNALSQGYDVPISYIAGRSIHGGLDIRGKLGTPITALVGGTVTLSRLNGGWGENIIIRTVDGHAHWYAHLTTRLVAVGDQVQTGAVIGTLGTTGYSTGPHLHFEVRTMAGKLVDPFTLQLVPENPEFAAAWDKMRATKVFSKYTKHDTLVTTDMLAVFLSRLNPNA